MLHGLWMKHWMQRKMQKLVTCYIMKINLTLIQRWFQIEKANQSDPIELFTFLYNYNILVFLAILWLVSQYNTVHQYRSLYYFAPSKGLPGMIHRNCITYLLVYILSTRWVPVVLWEILGNILNSYEFTEFVYTSQTSRDLSNVDSLWRINSEVMIMNEWS